MVERCFQVGHALHDLDPVFKKYSSSDNVKGLLKSLGYVAPVAVQSMYIFKVRADVCDASLGFSDIWN